MANQSNLKQINGRVPQWAGRDDIQTSFLGGGMGDLYFDLANLAAHHEFGDEQERRLLTNYFGCASSAQQARLRLMKIMSDFRKAMWGMVQIGISRLDFDFGGCVSQHFDRMAKSMYHPDYQQWLVKIRNWR